MKYEVRQDSPERRFIGRACGQSRPRNRRGLWRLRGIVRECRRRRRRRARRGGASLRGSHPCCIDTRRCREITTKSKHPRFLPLDLTLESWVGARNCRLVKGRSGLIEVTRAVETGGRARPGDARGLRGRPEWRLRARGGRMGPRGGGRRGAFKKRLTCSVVNSVFLKRMRMARNAW